jgi:hypothetical protein
MSAISKMRWKFWIAIFKDMINQKNAILMKKYLSKVKKKKRKLLNFQAKIKKSNSDRMHRTSQLKPLKVLFAFMSGSEIAGV